MKLFRYTEYITESKLELLLEANMIFSKDFLATLFNLKNPIAEKILKLYKTDVDVDTNYIDLSDKENFVSFKSDKKSKNSCVIVNIGTSYTELSKRLFPSFAKLLEQPNIKNGYISWWELLPRNQKATIIDEIKTDSYNGQEIPNTLKYYIGTGRKIYHIRFNLNGENIDLIIEDQGLQIGEKTVTPQEVRVGSLIQSLLKKSGQEVNPSELEDFVIKFNNAVKSKRENIFKDFKIVKDEDIRKYYLYESYESDNHTLGGSCMRYEKCQKYLDIYVKNPNQVSMVILFSEKDPEKIRGRALLWTDVKYGLRDLVFPKPGAKKETTEYDGKPFMDRIYVNNSQDEELFKEFAKKNGFIYKKNQDFSKIGFLLNGEETRIERLDVKLDYNSFEYYPYIDTLANYTPHNSNLNNYSGEYTLNETDGTNGEEEGCETCGGEEYIDCSRCGGGGEINCWKCDGDGETECENCRGGGQETCSMCDGSGRGEDGESECENCSGDGDVTCGDCEGSGNITCSRCDGNADIECPECEGNGRERCPDC
jgi:hypothetical protein